jgi:hypothetical protein
VYSAPVETDNASNAGSVYPSPEQAPAILSNIQEVNVNAEGSGRNYGNMVYSGHSRPFPTPAFTGAPGTLTSVQWLKNFEKLRQYYSWSKEVQLIEFMMAMQGHANTWWETLTPTVLNNVILIQWLKNSRISLVARRMRWLSNCGY